MSSCSGRPQTNTLLTLLGQSPELGEIAQPSRQPLRFDPKERCTSAGYRRTVVQPDLGQCIHNGSVRRCGAGNAPLFRETGVDDALRKPAVRS